MSLTNEEYTAVKYADKITIKEVENVNKGSEYVLLPEQIQNLINHAPSNRDKVMIELMGFCGLRRDEVRLLRVELVNNQDHVLHLVNTKRGKKRVVPISNDILRDLSWLAGQRKTGYLFESREGVKLSRSQINRILGSTGQRAGITNPNPRLKNINPHLLRHSFARNFLRSGGRKEVLQKILGHSSITTTIGIYGAPSIQDLKDEYNKFIGDQK